MTDLNDFISPSQACIKPVEQTDKKPEEKYVGAKTEIVVDSSGSYYEVASEGAVQLNNTSAQIDNEASTGTKLEQAQISLNDCLACSGCITSAESILITLQSHAEVFTFLDSNKDATEGTKKLPVLSIAPQPLASLAASLTASACSSSSSSAAPPITPHQVLRRVQAFCREALGIAHVFDTTFARHLALREHLLEFEERKAKDKLGGEAAQGQLPMLASACPGWICYAEKAHSEMLPFISRTKSPQQVMGTLVKEWVGKHAGFTPDKVYHVSVMPCYDKKLEASRQDFYNDVYSTRDVDCVITTGELELMMREKGWDLAQPVPGELDEEAEAVNAESTALPELIQHAGSSSGSYLMSIIEHLQRESAVPLTLSSKIMRNADYEEFTLTVAGSGKTVFKGAKCYGFRNLQNVVRKVGRERGVRTAGGAAGRLAGRAGAGVGRRLKKAGGGGDDDGGKDKQYDYVEVMACPGGCVNGGGQLKPVLPKPQESGVDEEGYPRDWVQTGVVLPETETEMGATTALRADVDPPSVAAIESGVVTNAKWGDKDWTRRVEAAYWLDGSLESMGQAGVQCDEEGSGAAEIKMNGGPHDPDAPPRTGTISSTRQVINDNGGLDTLRAMGGGREGPTVSGRTGGRLNVKSDATSAERRRSAQRVRKQRWAEKLADRVLKELCGSDNDAVKNRHRFFRTEYHAVESDVGGLAVKW